MPYITNEDLPEHIKKYSEKSQSQWRHVFNSVYDKIMKEENDVKKAEARAFAAANSVLGKRMSNEKHFDHADQFNHNINKWLGIYK